MNQVLGNRRRQLQEESGRGIQGDVMGPWRWHGDTELLLSHLSQDCSPNKPQIPKEPPRGTPAGHRRPPPWGARVPSPQAPSSGAPLEGCPRGSTEKGPALWGPPPRGGLPRGTGGPSGGGRMRKQERVGVHKMSPPHSTCRCSFPPSQGAGLRFPRTLQMKEKPNSP